MAAELECVMIHQAMPTVAYILTGPSTASCYLRETGGRKQPLSPQHCWILGLEPKPYLVKYKLFQIPKGNLGHIDIYQEDLRARTWAKNWYLECANCPYRETLE